MVDAFLPLLVALLLLGLPIVCLILGVVAYVRTERIAALVRRVERLEAVLRGLAAPIPTGATGPAPAEASGPAPEPVELVPVEAVPEVSVPAPVPLTSAAALPSAVASPRAEAAAWEWFFGRKALGWLAVMALLFAATFFLRYAFENNWIGPLGQIACALAGGAVLVVLAQRYHGRGWRAFAQALTTGGIVVLYLSVYAGFARYDLLPLTAAFIALVVLVAEATALSVRYDSLVIALAALVGALATPVLLRSEHDQYRAMFVYLVAVNAGVLGLLFWRAWPALGTVALLGTQALFWTWYQGAFHPEKLGWAVGFQAAQYGLFLGHSLAIHVIRPRQATWEDLLRLVLTAGFGFFALYVLLDDYRDWMGSAALLMAAGYALLARGILARRADLSGPVVTALGIAAGLVAVALPIQAETHWIALGWMVEGALLWWFGNRVGSPPLRAMAGALAAASVLRLLGADLPGPRAPFVPVLNTFALPALATAGALLAALVAARRFFSRLDPGERTLAWVAAIAGILLVLVVLSVDCFGYFEAYARLEPASRRDWLWMGQMALSGLWSAFAAGLLVIGFAVRLPALRWLALGLFGLTVAKVFIVDMAELDRLYRIGAFFVLAIFLGLAARAYQRIRSEANRPVEDLHDVAT